MSTLTRLTIEELMTRLDPLETSPLRIAMHRVLKQIVALPSLPDCDLTFPGKCLSVLAVSEDGKCYMLSASLNAVEWAELNLSETSGVE